MRELPGDVSTFSWGQGRASYPQRFEMTLLSAAPHEQMVRRRYTRQLTQAGSPQVSRQTQQARELPGDEPTFFPARFAAQDDATSKLRAYWFVPCSMLRRMHYTRQLTQAGSPRYGDQTNYRMA